MEKNLYRVCGFNSVWEYNIVANSILDAADIFHKIVGTSYEIKEIVFLFKVYVKEE